MSNLQLLPYDGEGCPFLPSDDMPTNKKLVYKIYNDGGHYIATIATRPSPQVARIHRKLIRGGYKKGYTETKGFSEREDIDILFDSLYKKACADGLKDHKIDKSMTDFIRDGILKLFPQYPKLDEFIANKIKRKANNLHHRKKRFRRKVSLNRWNYFVTFTYDDNKQTEKSFEKRLRKCFSNLGTRRGWKVAGKFERAPETGRLHFHGLLYVPDGEMIGTIAEKRDYSTVDEKMQTRHENDFFEKAFGRNDFDEVTEMEMRNGLRQEYILKYIEKDDGRMFYSRGIPSEIYRQLPTDEIVTALKNDFDEKFILFDNVVNWERDIMRYRYIKQMTVYDWLCNPPRVA